ncbi:hypothetical protein FFI89_031935 [Bradyrhizobium sp. KBS0727]|nr:hypothetical protein FFI71_031940 [Bradyrhizobium sp. KBS0725]QDW47933.1 hypothetical protein FFI89_031935 [Bradyrhizobium sp. KBS0727]
MPELVPGIHVCSSVQKRQDVDGRDKPGHDGWAAVSSLSERIVTGSGGRSSRNSCDVRPSLIAGRSN